MILIGDNLVLLDWGVFARQRVVGRDAAGENYEIDRYVLSLPERNTLCAALISGGLCATISHTHVWTKPFSIYLYVRRLSFIFYFRQFLTMDHNVTMSVGDIFRFWR